MEAHISEQVQRKWQPWQSKVSHPFAITSTKCKVTFGCLCKVGCTPLRVVSNRMSQVSPEPGQYDHTLNWCLVFYDSHSTIVVMLKSSISHHSIFTYDIGTALQMLGATKNVFSHIHSGATLKRRQDLEGNTMFSDMPCWDLTRKWTE